MEIINWILEAFLGSLVILNFFKIHQLERRLILSVASVNDLTFKFNEMVEFLENQIARVHYDQLKHAGHLAFNEETSLDEVLAHPGAREILIGSKLIKNKDQSPFEKSLADQSKQMGVPLEPVLIALNDLEVV